MIKLPEPKKYFGLDAEPDFSYYTEGQMREYAAAVSDELRVQGLIWRDERDALRGVVEGAAAADEFLENPAAIYRLARMARAALKTAEAALSDIGDSDREPGDDLAWCERRAAQALPEVRAALGQK
jgi:hypothetical protein